MDKCVYARWFATISRFVVTASSCMLLRLQVIHYSQVLVQSTVVNSRLKPSVHTYKFILMIRYRFHLISFSFPKLYLFATWFSWTFTMTQLQPSRSYPIVIKTISTCTGLFPVISVVLSYQLILWILSIFKYVYSHL